LHFGKTEIFLQTGLDKQFIYRHALICPSGKSGDPSAWLEERAS
jgi:hypothetical protein